MRERVPPLLCASPRLCLPTTHPPPPPCLSPAARLRPQFGFPVPYLMVGRWGVVPLPAKVPLLYLVGEPLQPPPHETGACVAALPALGPPTRQLGQGPCLGALQGLVRLGGRSVQQAHPSRPWRRPPPPCARALLCWWDTSALCAPPPPCMTVPCLVSPPPALPQQASPWTRRPSKRCTNATWTRCATCTSATGTGTRSTFTPGSCWRPTDGMQGQTEGRGAIRGGRRILVGRIIVGRPRLWRQHARPRVAPAGSARTALRMAAAVLARACLCSRCGDCLALSKGMMMHEMHPLLPLWGSGAAPGCTPGAGPGRPHDSPCVLWQP